MHGRIAGQHQRHVSRSGDFDGRVIPLLSAAGSAEIQGRRTDATMRATQRQLLNVRMIDSPLVGIAPPGP